MAVKKAPMKKTVAAKKPATKVKSSGKKKGQDGSVYNENYPSQGLYKEERKAGQEARKRAKKYGSIAGPTGVSVNKGKDAYTRDVSAATVVRSKRGNYYRVAESKDQVAGARDKNRSTFINASEPSGKVRVNFKATGKRDAKFGPAPKVKKKK
jgi:hypothetical protein